MSSFVGTLTFIFHDFLSFLMFSLMFLNMMIKYFKYLNIRVKGVYHDIYLVPSMVL